MRIANCRRTIAIASDVSQALRGMARQAVGPFGSISRVVKSRDMLAVKLEAV